MKVDILGAGLAGLSAAYHSKGCLYEKEKEIGGTCRALKSKGFTFDFGIHVLHSTNNYVLNLLKKIRGVDWWLKRRSAWIYSHNVLTKYPFQANTFGLPSQVITECIGGFARVFGKKVRNFDNYQDWVYANFGKGIADNFYLPYSEKFWTIKAHRLTTDWLDVRVPRPRLEEVIAGAISLQKKEFGPNAVFRYPKHGGIGSIAKSLLKRNNHVIMGKEAVKIELDKKTVHFSDGSRIYYENLISTLPLPELFKILNKVPALVMQAVRALKYTSVLCLNFGIKRGELSDYHWIYFPEEKFAPFRISFPKNFSSYTVPKNWSSLQAEISYSMNKPIKNSDIVEKTVGDLIRAKIIKPKENIKLISTKDIKYAYVIYDHYRLSNLKKINNFLRKYNIYTAGRYGKWEYLWMDEAIISGKDVLNEIINKKR